MFPAGLAPGWSPAARRTVLPAGPTNKLLRRPACRTWVRPSGPRLQNPVLAACSRRYSRRCGNV